jgi:MFS family permease
MVFNFFRHGEDGKAAATEKVQPHVSIGSNDSSDAPKHELHEEDPLAYPETGFGFKQAKKWIILSVIFFVQVSMNFNAAIYGNAVPGMADEFGRSESALHYGQAAFLVAYAFGCELWAPWSEELGRKWVMQGSLFLVNVFQLPCMFSHSLGMTVFGRVMGGLSSAGGSVTLGIVADMFVGIIFASLKKKTY